jgi:hypothetical protein
VRELGAWRAETLLARELVLGVEGGANPVLRDDLLDEVVERERLRRE